MCRKLLQTSRLLLHDMEQNSLSASKQSSAVALSISRQIFGRYLELKEKHFFPHVLQFIIYQSCCLSRLRTAFFIKYPQIHNPKGIHKIRERLIYRRVRSGATRPAYSINTGVSTSSGTNDTDNEHHLQGYSFFLC